MRNPFIAGSWVRGDNFFGREATLREILEGERDCVWVVGARRLGKTSLLKQLEWRAQRSGDTPYAALFWDLQGSGDARGLGESFLSSLEDSEPFRRATGSGVDAVESLPIADMVTTILRRTVRSGWRLLLLIDEAEELLSVSRNTPSVLPRLRRLFQKGPEIRTVLTSTRRLARVDTRTEIATSPFLQAFIPPLYLTPLSEEEARTLLARGSFAKSEVDTIVERTGRHPFLLQLLASRLFETRDLVATLDQLASDEMISNFFAVDFQTLQPLERSILEAVAHCDGACTTADLARATASSEELIGAELFGLRMMGYLEARDGHYRLGNWFFDRWLRRVISGSRSGEARDQ
jgi:hypothetical protein